MIKSYNNVPVGELWSDRALLWMFGHEGEWAEWMNVSFYQRANMLGIWFLKMYLAVIQWRWAVNNGHNIKKTKQV